MLRIRHSLWAVALFSVFVVQSRLAQGRAARPWASSVVVPQSRAFPIRNGRPVEITGVAAAVAIVEQVATTTLDISLRNPTRRRLEAELLVPVPVAAAVRGFTYQGAGAEPSAEVLRKEEARRIYDSIVAKVRDPALLEFIGYNLIRTSLFPVEANATQKVRLVYEHLLPRDGSRVDYDLPRSESLEYRVPWDIRVTIRSKRPISTVYSPSHKIDVTRRGPAAMAATVAKSAGTEPGPFRLSYLIEGEGVTASLIAYPDPKINGGYFLLLAGLPADPAPAAGAAAIKREVTLVLDRSGSMNGEKIEQVREAALQVLAGLDEGEAFNIIPYHTGVDQFADAPVPKTPQTEKAARAYLKSIKARGGTNIHDALVEALRPKPLAGALPIVLFFTDGLPTVGQTSEAVIRDVAMKANRHHRRVFTFGVGVDVNTPLLDKIASETRGTTTYVLPKEDVEVKVAQVFKRLVGPVLADPELAMVGPDGKPALGRVKDLLPSRLPDMFEGSQLVLLGQYVGEDPLTFRLSGNYMGRPRTFRFTFALDKATTRNAFVPRLWATRKIALLVDAVRQLGANGTPAVAHAAAAADPRVKELVDEIVRLSTEFGILTEYTAFLAREGSDLNEVLAETGRTLSRRAIQERSGLGAVSQGLNMQFRSSQIYLNRGNAYFDAKMNRVSVSSVQQVNDRAFYRRGARWIDSRILNRADTAKPDQVIAFGSPEFRALASRLAQQNRQGSIALQGDILMVVNGQTILVQSAPAR